MGRSVMGSDLGDQMQDVFHLSGNRGRYGAVTDSLDVLADAHEEIVFDG